MRNNILRNLILFLAILISMAETFGYAEVEQAVNTEVQPSVAISKTISQETGSINPTTGVHTGLNANFKIQTNGTDENYDFILTSKINTMDGEMSAYTQNGNLIFSNNNILPTRTAVEDVIVGGRDNANVIAYPLNMSITSPMTVEFGNTLNNGECWIVKLNSGTEGSLTQVVGETPIVNSYSLGQDEAGTYNATIIFSAISK